MSQQNIVQIKMEDPNGVIPKLQALAKICPKECERAQLRAASIMPRKIVAAIRGLNVQGAGGKLPALSDISKALRPQKPGGLLTSEKGLCRVMTSNGKLIVGFVGRVANVAELWQEGGTKPVSINQRRRMHIILGKKGLSAIEVPTQSIQPERLVVDSLAETFGREMPRWIFGALEKIIDKKLAGPKKEMNDINPVTLARIIASVISGSTDIDTLSKSNFGQRVSVFMDSLGSLIGADSATIQDFFTLNGITRFFPYAIVGALQHDDGLVSSGDECDIGIIIAIDASLDATGNKINTAFPERADDGVFEVGAAAQLVLLVEAIKTELADSSLSGMIQTFSTAYNAGEQYPVQSASMTINLKSIQTF